MTIVVELEGEVIGDLMLRLEDAWAQAEVADQARGVQAELGWVLHPDHAGHGYATEAVRELIRICFEDLGLRRVTAECFADNVASWRLMERVGMRREAHTVRDSLHRSGAWLDGMGYALLAEEWRGAAETPRALTHESAPPRRARPIREVEAQRCARLPVLRPVSVEAMTTRTAATAMATNQRTQSTPALPLPPNAR